MTFYQFNLEELRFLRNVLTSYSPDNEKDQSRKDTFLREIDKEIILKETFERRMMEYYDKKKYYV